MELNAYNHVRPAARRAAENPADGPFSDPRKVVPLLGLAEGMQIADFGAGSGHYSLAAARAVGHSGTLYAIDAQSGLLARIKSAADEAGLRNLTVVSGDIERVGGTRLRDGLLDGVLLCNVLFQLEQKGNVLVEIKRVLHPKGRLLAIDWKDSFNGAGPPRSDVVTEEEARTMFTQAGFSVEKSFPAGTHHWGLIARKP